MFSGHIYLDSNLFILACLDKCEFNYIVKGSRHEQNFATKTPVAIHPSIGLASGGTPTFPSTSEEHFRLGFNECMSEAMHFLVEEEGMYPGDSLCIRILKHLRTHSENLMRDHFVSPYKLWIIKEQKWLCNYIYSYIYICRAKTENWDFLTNHAKRKNRKRWVTQHLS